jgi:hypothetical protein
MTFTLNAEVAAVLATAIEQNGPPSPPPVSDVASRRGALDGQRHERVATGRALAVGIGAYLGRREACGRDFPGYLLKQGPSAPDVLATWS